MMLPVFSKRRFIHLITVWRRFHFTNLTSQAICGRGIVQFAAHSLESLFRLLTKLCLSLSMFRAFPCFSRRGDLKVLNKTVFKQKVRKVALCGIGPCTFQNTNNLLWVTAKVMHRISAQILLYPCEAVNFLLTSHASISPMILSISSRSACSRATIFRISAFSFPMSIFSRVSSAST